MLTHTKQQTQRIAPSDAETYDVSNEATLPARPKDATVPLQEQIANTAADRASTLKGTPSLSHEGASKPIPAHAHQATRPHGRREEKCKAEMIPTRGAIASRQSARTTRRVDASFKQADPARRAQRNKSAHDRYDAQRETVLCSHGCAPRARRPSGRRRMLKIHGDQAGPIRIVH